MIYSFLRSAIPQRLHPSNYLTRLAQKKTGFVVQNGPFVGMRYINISQGSAYIPKLLGIYEKELTPHIEKIISLSPSLVVDLGAAEGYYAIGLALRLTETRVIAFEMEERGRKAIDQMRNLNGVAHRLEIRGKCEPADLNSVLNNSMKTVIVCDVEGYEQFLLDPCAVPALRFAAILVELHDFIVPNIGEIIKDRFSVSHDICHVWQEPRTTEDFPWRTMGTTLLPKSYLQWAVSEWRPVRMAWFMMTPREYSTNAPSKND